MDKRDPVSDTFLLFFFRGARHGLTMNAKLARLEQQEAEFMAKYGKKSQPASASPVCVEPTPPTSQSAEQRAESREEADEDGQRKKVKKKKRPTGSIIELNGDEVSESPETDVKPKKKKKKKKKTNEDTEEMADAVSTGGDVICVENGEADDSHKAKKKNKKKKKNAELNEEERAHSPVAESPEETAELHAETKVKKKKKKKSSKHDSEPVEAEESNSTESSQSEPVQDCVIITEKESADLLEADTTGKRKRKKCKKDKPSVDEDINEEALPPKKKKKKKSKE